MSISYWVRFALSMFALKKLKSRSIVYYLKALQVVRKSIRAIFFLLIFSQIFLVGLLMVIYGVIQLIPTDLEVKMYILLGFGIGFMLISTIAVLILTSDSLWFKMSGVQDHLKNK